MTQPPVGVPLTPCIAVHTEQTQLPRYAARLHGLAFAADADTPVLHVHVVATSSPLVYARVQEKTTAESKCIATSSLRTQDSCCSSRVLAQNALLRTHVEEMFGSGRIRAHRVYQLDWSCVDPEWIPLAAQMRALNKRGACFRVVAFPKQLQSKITALLQLHAYATHPKAFTHELFVTMQPSVSPYVHFGVALRSNSSSSNSIEQASDIAAPAPRIANAADAPCRAYFKMAESLQHVSLRPGDRVLDVGASPGGWTACLLAHGAHVVAVDPGELTIDVVDKPVVHVQLLLEDAQQQLARLAPFAMCVCDINVRVAHMASLIASVAPLLLHSAHVVLTLKLGKKPTARAVQQAFDDATALLTPSFEHFQLLWLHANTQNERTLIAVRR